MLRNTGEGSVKTLVALDHRVALLATQLANGTIRAPVAALLPSIAAATAKTAMTTTSSPASTAGIATTASTT